jgi:hypothetical protein
MDEMLVGKLWMMGVLAMMAVFGFAAMIGYRRAKRNGLLDEISEESKS